MDDSSARRREYIFAISDIQKLYGELIGIGANSAAAADLTRDEGVKEAFEKVCMSLRGYEAAVDAKQLDNWGGNNVPMPVVAAVITNTIKAALEARLHFPGAPHPSDVSSVSYLLGCLCHVLSNTNAGAEEAQPTQISLKDFEVKVYSSFTSCYDDLDSNAGTDTAANTDQSATLALEDASAAAVGAPGTTPVHIPQATASNTMPMTGASKKKGKKASKAPAKMPKKASFTSSFGTECEVHLWLYSKVEYRDAHSRKDGYDGYTWISAISHDLHNHEMMLPDLMTENAVKTKRLFRVAEFLKAGFNGSMIMKCMRMTGKAKSDQHEQDYWHDIYSLAEKDGSMRSVGELNKAVEHIKDNNGLARISFSRDSGGTFPLVITWCTAEQQALVEMGIADAIAIDATYGILKCGMPVVQVAAKTATENVVPLIQAIIFNERETTYEKLLEHIFAMVGLKSIKTIFTDSDTALMGALHKYEKKVKHHLCTFHKRANLTTVASLVAKNGEHETVVYEFKKAKLIRSTEDITRLNVQFLELSEQAFNKVIYTRGESEYNGLKDQFIESFPLPYQDRVCGIFDSEEHFVQQYTYKWRTLGWESSSAAESTHSALKHALREQSYNRLTFDKFIERDFAFIKRHLSRVEEHVQFEKSIWICHLPSAFMRESAHRLPRAVAADIFINYLASKNEYVATAAADVSNMWLVHRLKHRDSDAVYLASDASTKVTCEIGNAGEQWQCDCFRYEREGRPCAHIMAARRANNIAKRSGAVHTEDENNIIRLSDIDRCWLFPVDGSAETSVPDDDGMLDTSFKDYLQSLVLSLLEDIKDLSEMSQVSHISTVLSYSRCSIDSDYAISEHCNLDGDVRKATTKGHPSGKKITSDKTVAVKALEECEKRDKQAKRKNLAQGNTDTTAPAQAKKPRFCSVCKQSDHNKQTCPNNKNDAA
ncbi:hypothetical protein H4R20_001331 [Coemansia guatemalensis]|uniref:SWIM-type domain-containing protein n=1 Tax=Coemansia guatemalensis TaxID=2761395 RepID=A0A9W8LTB5_9FUNG|nr:hypothetical protein H4R20_001331 [Coemansia guatemalensis]